jgi:hypothetical protein
MIIIENDIEKSRDILDKNGIDYTFKKIHDKKPMEVVHDSNKIVHEKKKRTPKKRSPEEQKIMNERMAKIRSQKGLKKKV